MNFLIGENIYTFNSGTEHAAAKRTRLFNDAGDPAVYVTRNYNRFLTRDAKTVGLKQSEVLSMYDYFQGTQQVDHEPQNLRLLPQIPLDEYHIVGHGANYSTIDHAGRELARINIIPGTVGMTSDIVYYDRYGNTVSRENFDWRGFKSSVDYFHPDGSLAYQHFLNRDGVPVLEVSHMNVNGNLQPTMWKLLNYKGHNFRFNMENQLFLFLLNELMLDYPGATLMSDRRSLDAVVADVKGAGARYAVLHDIHTPKVSNPVKGKLYPAYVDVLERRVDDFDAILVPTPEQQRDLKQRYPNRDVRVVPDTFIAQDVLDAPVMPLTQRQQHQLIFVGRLAAEKQPEQAIHMLARIRQRHEDATLTFYGYFADSKIEKELKDLVDTLQLAEQVTFAGYISGEELAKAYREGQVLVQTSTAEGFGMNILEAMSYGTPVASFDINYGVADLINQDNGLVARAGARAELADKISDLFDDDDRWQAMSQAARKTASHYAEQAEYAAWQKALAAQTIR